MGLWKVAGDEPNSLERTKLDKQIIEKNLESWIEQNPDLLEEPLLIIGRQVPIPDLGDQIDLLALDPQGSAVVIEVKRGQLRDPVEFQGLRYASYVSKWQYDDFENRARKYLGSEADSEFSLNERLEKFTVEAGTDEVPDLNDEQRIVLVGSGVRDRLGSVALWLREHSVDIRLVDVHAYEDGDDLLLQPNIVVPVQVSDFSEVGKQPAEKKPWIRDGRGWHLEKRCSTKTREALLQLDELLQEQLEVDGPHWSQKHYVSYRVNNFNWLAVNTSSQTLRLDFNVQADAFDAASLADALHITVFDSDASFGEKIKLPSSVNVSSRTDTTDKVQIRIKDDFEFESEPFVNFLERAYAECPR